MGRNHALFMSNVVPGLDNGVGWNRMTAIPNPINLMQWDRWVFTHDVFSDALFNLVADPVFEGFVDANIHWNAFQFSLIDGSGGLQKT